MIPGRGRFLIALAHHDPTGVLEHFAAVLLAAGRTHINDAGLAARVLLEPDHLRDRVQGVAGIDRSKETTFGIAEIGDGIERDVGNSLAEDDVKHQEIVDGRARVPDRPREGIRRLRRKARAEEPAIERDIAHRERPRRRVPDHLADAEILEKVTGSGLHHDC